VQEGGTLIAITKTSLQQDREQLNKLSAKYMKDLAKLSVQIALKDDTEHNGGAGVRAIREACKVDDNLEQSFGRSHSHDITLLVRAAAGEAQVQAFNFVEYIKEEMTQRLEEARKRKRAK
jgi:hypothetical protein